MSGGSAIQTVSGRRVDPLAPRAEDLDVRGGAPARAPPGRFGGPSRDHKTVAQHNCPLDNHDGHAGGSPDHALRG
ncbi:MAG: phosphohydrolase, partial [Thermoleophilia bacterium]|nr:phosphohydrolase [Thermoleophilia bacterium]